MKLDNYCCSCCSCCCCFLSLSRRSRLRFNKIRLTFSFSMGAISCQLLIRESEPSSLTTTIDFGLQNKEKKQKPIAILPTGPNSFNLYLSLTSTLTVSSAVAGSASSGGWLLLLAVDMVRNREVKVLERGRRNIMSRSTCPIEMCLYSKVSQETQEVNA